MRESSTMQQMMIFLGKMWAGALVYFYKQLRDSEAPIRMHFQKEQMLPFLGLILNLWQKKTEMFRTWVSGIPFSPFYSRELQRTRVKPLPHMGHGEEKLFWVPTNTPQ